MRVVAIYNEERDYTREVLDYLRDFERQTGHAIESLDPDSPEGMHFCRTYDIVEYPTLIATSDDGAMQNMWRGLPLPTISEVSFYV